MADGSDAGSLGHPQGPGLVPGNPGAFPMYNPNPPPAPVASSMSLGGGSAAGGSAADEEGQSKEGPTLEEMIFMSEITDKVEEVGDVKGQKEEDKYDQLGSVLVTKEEIPPGTERKFAANLHDNFQTCQRFLGLLCRVPVTSTKGDDTEVTFQFEGNTCRGILFFITAIFFAIILFMMMINLGSTMMNVPSQPENLNVSWWIKYAKEADASSPNKDQGVEVNWESWFESIEYPKKVIPIKPHAEDTARNIPEETGYVVDNKKKNQLRAEEMFVFRRNLASMLIVLACLGHIVMCDWKMFRRRHFVASYLSYWAESVEIMKIDAAGDVGKYLASFLFYYFSWFIIFMFVNFVNVAPVSSGAPVEFVILWFRCAYPPAYSLPDIYITAFRYGGGAIFFFIILCSKAYVFLFLFICKILKTTCIIWNERLEAVFTIEERKKTRAEKCISRTGYDHLFKDYVTILDLMSGANTLFTNVLESYFSITLISIVFEVYYLIRPVATDQDEFKEARVFDMLVVGVLLFNSIMCFYLTAVGAAEVSVAAADGLEIIRRQGIMGHRSDEEMHFMISVYMSFTGHFDCSLCGGGYFALNKPFLIGIAGALISYIIIIFQFQPTLGLGSDDQKVLVGVGSDENVDIAKLKTLVFHVENTWWYFKENEPGY